MKALSLDQLKAKTEEFRGRLAAGETLVDMLPEVRSEIDRHRAFFSYPLCPLNPRASSNALRRRSQWSVRQRFV